MTFQHGAGDGFGLPERGQPGGGFGGLSTGRGGRVGRRRDGDFGSMQRGRRFGADQFDARALQGEQFGFGAADRTGDVAVAAGLACLPLQVAELAFQLGA